MSAFEKLMVCTKTAEYPIYIDDSFGSLVQAFAEAGLAGRRALIVADTNTSRLFGDTVLSIVSEVCAEAGIYVVTPGEQSKALDAASGIYERCISLGLDRTSVIIALGGGIVGDLAGFVAATYMRGVALVQLPTTLLAQVDSSVGGKTAVNFHGLKNIIGAFYQPGFVYANIGALPSLPRADFLSGLAEAIKHGLIYNASYLNFILQNKQAVSDLDFEALAGVVYGSCHIKAEVVLKDEREQNIRELLNFGHTFAHGIESVSDFSIPHGHAVAIGCAAALRLSREKGLITSEELDTALGLYEFFKLPVSVQGYPAQDIYAHMKRDKKSKNGVLTVILLNGMGSAYAETALAEREIMRAIDAITVP